MRITRRRRRYYRRSLGDDEFDDIDDFGIDDIGEVEFLGGMRKEVLAKLAEKIGKAETNE